MTMHFYFGGFFALVSLIASLLIPWFAGNENSNYAKISGGIAWFALFLTALIAPLPFNPGYKGAILFCIIIAGLALLFYRVIPGPDSTAGAFLLINLPVLFFTFISVTSFQLPTPLVLLAPAIGLLAYTRLRPPRPELRPAIIAYIVLLAAATWQAAEMVAQYQSIGVVLALIGTLMLWAVAAFHYAAHRRPTAPRLTGYTVAALLLAHWFLALSIWPLFHQ
jgi:uncharacterized membrane protein YhhN